jgi:SAM-dependent methyltransferase
MSSNDHALRVESSPKTTNKTAPSYWKRIFRFLTTEFIVQLDQRTHSVGPSRNQWGRIVMNRETRDLIGSLPPPTTLDVLEISGTVWEKLMPFKSYRSCYYPEFDICDMTLDQTFDLIIAEQVFEHLLWPYRAGKHVYQMLNPGGHFLITVPFLLRIHDYPVDCTRWTETGLKYFLAECGFPLDNIRTGSWGNRACVRANFGANWASYRSRFHSLENEPDFPIHVWALAQK